ncbi:uncharacterized protein [Branchiostoma lanceolatum]|uniref:uncharacterized protein n=1 Tax=Branchiostoma lanceolatum TaxID=7740 RepID=UPI003456DA7E
MKFQVCLVLLVTSVLVLQSSAFRIRPFPTRYCSTPPTHSTTYRRSCRAPYTNGERCTYRCRPGYTIASGSTVRTCTNGVWTGAMLVCRPAPGCSTPPTVAYTYRRGCYSPYTSGERCTYRCRRGYTQVSGSTVRTCTNGVWTGTNLVCRRGCVNPPTVADTTRFGCSPYYTTGENCYYKCTNRNEYCKEVSGDYIRRCLSNGHWSGTNLVCDCVDKIGCCRPDIVFVLDYSGSIPDSEFVKVKNFVAALVNRLQVGVLDAQIGVIRYSSSVIHEFHLNTHDNKADVLADVSAMPTATSGGTNTGAALTYVANTMLLPGNGNRPDAPDVVIVLTDGYSYPPNVAGPASVLHGMGVQTFAIGVGGCANSAQLAQIASCPDYIYRLPDFSALKSITASMHDQICCHNQTFTCPANYERVEAGGDTKCLRFFSTSTRKDRRNYQAASQACRADGARLVVIKSAALNTFIVNRIQTTYGAGTTVNAETWIGLDDLTAPSGQYRWSDGSVLGGGDFNDWSPGQPDSGGEKCVEIRSYFSYKWNNHYCTVLKNFICEKVPASPACCPKKRIPLLPGDVFAQADAQAARLSPPVPPAQCRAPADEEEGETRG